ncbi:MAG: DUF4392 domain-containing protein [Bifidobacteriaceae bacterium]|jgi:hypothetical protein|nr:DUF4392 domain-containing protein [Bifidobacteriaceae bacterium]
MPQVLGEYIDRLATVEMRPASGNLPRGAMHRLYGAVRRKYGEPLVTRAVRAFAEAAEPGANVVILTGAGGPPVLPHSEVDGIPGAVALARALHFGFGLEVTILSEARAEPPIRATVRAAGMNYRRPGQPAQAHAVTFEVSPIDRAEAAAHAEDLMGRLDPAIMIAIEKLAPNAKGIIHGATGIDYDALHTKPDEYFSRAAAKGILTFGIGDGGNEAGFGVVAEEIRDIMPAGRKCQCGCGGGSTTVLATDEFLVAAISDWGGYAVGAMTAFMTGAQRAMLTPSDLDRMLRACIDAGALDGAFGTPEIADDGVPLPGQLAYVQMLNTLVEVAQSTLDSPGH